MDNNKNIKSLVKLSKIIIWLLVAILIMLTFGVSKLYSKTTIDTKDSESSNEASEYNTKYDVSMMQEITADEVLKNTKKLSVVYVGRESCSWCAAFLPNLWDAQDDYGFKTLYVDIAKIIDFSSGNVTDQTAFDTMTKLTGEGYESYVSENFGSTPMILVMKDGKIVNALTGYKAYDDFKKILEDSGFTKK